MYIIACVLCYVCSSTWNCAIIFQEVQTWIHPLAPPLCGLVCLFCCCLCLYSLTLKDHKQKSKTAQVLIMSFSDGVKLVYSADAHDSCVDLYLPSLFADITRWTRSLRGLACDVHLSKCLLWVTLLLADCPALAVVPANKKAWWLQVATGSTKHNGWKWLNGSSI